LDEIEIQELIESEDDELFSSMEEGTERDGGQGSMRREENEELLLERVQGLRMGIVGI
jgi:hypothetical protein